MNALSRNPADRVVVVGAGVAGRLAEEPRNAGSGSSLSCQGSPASRDTARPVLGET